MGSGFEYWVKKFYKKFKKLFKIYYDKVLLEKVEEV